MQSVHFFYPSSDLMTNHTVSDLFTDWNSKTVLLFRETFPLRSRTHIKNQISVCIGFSCPVTTAEFFNLLKWFHYIKKKATFLRLSLFYAVNFFLPLALLAARTFLPPAELILARKPWTFARWRFFGWKVIFAICKHLLVLLFWCVPFQ